MLTFPVQAGEVPADDGQQGGGGGHRHGQLGGCAADDRGPVFPPLETADGELLPEESTLHHLTFNQQGAAVEETPGGRRPQDLAQASSCCKLIG